MTALCQTRVTCSPFSCLLPRSLHSVCLCLALVWQVPPPEPMKFQVIRQQDQGNPNMANDTSNQHPSPPPVCARLCAYVMVCVFRGSSFKYRQTARVAGGFDSCANRAMKMNWKTCEAIWTLRDLPLIQDKLPLPRVKNGVPSPPLSLGFVFCVSLPTAIKVSLVGRLPKLCVSSFLRRSNALRRSLIKKRSPLDKYPRAQLVPHVWREARKGTCLSIDRGAQ